MNYRVLCVGKLKEAYMRQACDDYAGRIRKYAKLDILEVPDERAPGTLSQRQLEQLCEREGDKLLAQAKGGLNVALDLGGKEMDSVSFAGWLHGLETSGQSSINFFIGGSNGLGRNVLAGAQRISLSSLTFPHNLARLILLEQLYRSAKINRGETYHK